MEHRLTLNGVPRALERDGWWLASEVPELTNRAGLAAKATSLKASKRLPQILGLLFLVFLADVLFWERQAGISLAIFAGAVFGIATLDIQPRLNLVRPTILIGLGSLPVVEFVQPLSVSILVASLVTALAWARLPTYTSRSLLAAVYGFVQALPRCLPRPIKGLIAETPRTTAFAANTRVFLRNWAFPVGGSLIIASLLLEANPVLSGLFDMRIDWEELIVRALFWLGIATLTYPFLTATPIDSDLPEFSGFSTQNGLSQLGINAASCLRALWVFNALIGLQSVTDLSIFLGGAELPQGMSYAHYAHRGAYPLLATALLAGGFALAAKPFLNEHRALKPLMYLWLAQNVALCVSAMLRLDLYVAAYGLTYLRIYAMIWMALVAGGLGLICWQILGNKSNGWLLACGTGLAALTLYLCSFVNFAGMIVTQNLTMAEPDYDYICDLNPTARGVLGHPEANGLAPHCPINQLKHRTYWQEWGLRNWRSGLYDPQNMR